MQKQNQNFLNKVFSNSNLEENILFTDTREEQVNPGLFNNTKYEDNSQTSDSYYDNNFTKDPYDLGFVNSDIGTTPVQQQPAQQQQVDTQQELSNNTSQSSNQVDEQTATTINKLLAEPVNFAKTEASPAKAIISESIQPIETIYLPKRRIREMFVERNLPFTELEIDSIYRKAYANQWSESNLIEFFNNEITAQENSNRKKEILVESKINDLSSNYVSLKNDVSSISSEMKNMFNDLQSFVTEKISNSQAEQIAALQKELDLKSKEFNLKNEIENRQKELLQKEPQQKNLRTEQPNFYQHEQIGPEATGSLKEQLRSVLIEEEHKKLILENQIEKLKNHIDSKIYDLNNSLQINKSISLAPAKNVYGNVKNFEQRLRDSYIEQEDAEKEALKREFQDARNVSLFLQEELKKINSLIKENTAKMEDKLESHSQQNEPTVQPIDDSTVEKKTNLGQNSTTNHQEKDFFEVDSLKSKHKEFIEELDFIDHSLKTEELLNNELELNNQDKFGLDENSNNSDEFTNSEWDKIISNRFAPSQISQPERKLEINSMEDFENFVDKTHSKFFPESENLEEENLSEQEETSFADDSEFKTSADSEKSLLEELLNSGTHDEKENGEDQKNLQEESKIFIDNTDEYDPVKNSYEPKTEFKWEATDLVNQKIDDSVSKIKRLKESLDGVIDDENLLSDLEQSASFFEHVKD